MRSVKDWNLLTKILLSGLFVLLLIAVPELLLETYYWEKTFRNTEMRRIAYSIQIELLKALRTEKELRMNDLLTSEFLQKGTVPNLRKHQTAMRALNAYLAELNRIAKKDEVDVGALQNLVSTYEQTFTRFISAVRFGSSPEQQTQLLQIMQQASDGVEPVIERAVRVSVDASDQAHDEFRLREASKHASSSSTVRMVRCSEIENT